jgi:hypothetical protein
MAIVFAISVRTTDPDRRQAIIHALCAHAQSLRFASPHWPPRHDFEWQLVQRRASDAVSH